jgi:hypothetical protein
MVNASGNRELIVESYYELPNGQVVRGLTTLGIGSGEQPSTIILPIQIEKITDLRASSDNLDKLIAASVERSFHQF